MKYTLEKTTQGENQVHILMREMDEEMEQLLLFLKTGRRKLLGSRDGQQVVVAISDILYIETVDGKTFVYTKTDVLQVDYTLTQLTELLNTVNFFRCSKSMILNIDKVESLRSLSSNRIDATMQGGEHILISRTYASDFRKRLKGDRDE